MLGCFVETGPRSLSTDLGLSLHFHFVSPGREGYNFYIDNMPTDDVQQLNCDQMDWLRKAVSGLSEVTVDVAHEGVAPEVKTGRPGSTVDTADLELILQEVQLDFARAMRLGMVVAGTFASIMHKQSLQPSPRQPLWPRNRVTFDTHILQAGGDRRIGSHQDHTIIYS